MRIFLIHRKTLIMREQSRDIKVFFDTFVCMLIICLPVREIYEKQNVFPVTPVLVHQAKGKGSTVSQNQRSKPCQRLASALIKLKHHNEDNCYRIRPRWF